MKGSLMAQGRCYHCEPADDRRKWLDPAGYCAWCRPAPMGDEMLCDRCRQRHPPECYCPSLVQERLRTLLIWRRKGLYRASHLPGLLETIDVEGGLRAAALAGRLSSLELNCIVLRLVQGLGCRQIAAQLGAPDPGDLLTRERVRAAVRRAARKVRDWLDGERPPTS